MKTSFQQADEIKDKRDKEFFDLWEKMKENGKKRTIKDALFKSFDMLNENEQDDGECQECGKSWYFCVCSNDF